MGGGFVVEHANGFKKVFNDLNEETAYRTACQHTQSFIRQQQGATNMIMKYVSDQINGSQFIG